MNGRIFHHVQQLFRSYAVLVSVSLALVFLFLHLFWPARFGIDSTSVALLALILAVPYLQLIRRVRFGEFEAEIEPQEVAAIQEKARKAQDHQQPTDRPQRVLMAYGGVVDLLERDPVLALASLRIYLESALRRAAEWHKFPRSQTSSALRLATQLAELSIIDKDTLSALDGVLRVANRAIHGAEISREDASRVIDSGLLLLRDLDSLATVEPVRVEQAEPAEEKSWSGAMYEVTTVVPYVDKPEKRVYHVTQSQLDQFLVGYDEYAEYLIALRAMEEEPGSSTSDSP